MRYRFSMSETTEIQNTDQQKSEKMEGSTTSTSDSTNQPDTPSKSSPGKNISPSKQENDMASKAFMHLAAGKRHLAVSDFKNAVTDLEEACRLLGEIFGEDGDECADGYYYYGLALLDLARQESGVLGDLPESEGSDEDKTDSEEQKEESEKGKEGTDIKEEGASADSKVANGNDAEMQAAKSADAEESKEDAEKQTGKPLEDNKEAGKSGEEDDKEAEKSAEDAEKQAGKSAEDAEKQAGKPSEDKKEAKKSSEHAEKQPGKPETDVETQEKEVDKPVENGKNGEDGMDVDVCEDGEDPEAMDDSMVCSSDVKDDVKEAVFSALAAASADESKKEKDCMVCRVEIAYCSGKHNNEKSEESAEEKGDEKETNEDEKEEENEEEKVENGKEEEEESEKAKENGTEKEEENPEEAAVEKGTENEEEEEDEVSNLQLAWEVLELAKVIFSRRRKEGLEIEKKLSMVFMKLGEVSLESENYAQSIEDLKNCLETRKKIFPPYHRDIAEVHYQLATALQFDKQYDLAIENYHGAMKVLEDKITYLNEVIQRRDAKEKGEEVTGDDGSEERAKDAFYREEDEIEEIKSLFPDLKEKITDTKDLKTEHLKKLAMASARLFAGEGSSGAGSSSSSGGASSSTSYNPSMLGFDDDSSKPSAAAVAAASPTKPAVNISHLVKRKRKPEEELEADPEEKKAKVVNGSSEQTLKE